MSDAQNCHCNPSKSRCLKITEKISFNIAFKNVKNAVKHCYQTGHFYLAKNSWKMPKMIYFKCDILSDFQTLCWSGDFNASIIMRVRFRFALLNGPNGKMVTFSSVIYPYYFAPLNSLLDEVDAKRVVMQ